MNYYIPEIEDIHVGYECELFVHKGDYDNRWVPFTLTPFVCKGQITSMSSSGNWRDLIKTPYLTKEQIENEGWVFQRTLGNDTYGYIHYYTKGDFYLDVKDKENKICIHNGESYSDAENYYYGKCPSINEFRKITKLLEI